MTPLRQACFPYKSQRLTSESVSSQYKGTNAPSFLGARFLLAITMFLTYPMEFFVTRFAIISAVQRRWAHVQHKDNIPHYGVTALLWVVTTLLGTFSTDLGIILDVTGSVAAVFLAFILPGWLSIKLDGLRFFSRAALKQGVLIVVGSFFMIVSSLLILLRELKVVTGEFKSIFLAMLSSCAKCRAILRNLQVQRFSLFLQPTRHIIASLNSRHCTAHFARAYYRQPSETRERPLELA
jgi:hypothetical protein